MTPSQLRALRLRLGMTQAEFSCAYRLSLRTVQNWEQGRDSPVGAAPVLLMLIEREPETIARLLADRSSP